MKHAKNYFCAWSDIHELIDNYTTTSKKKLHACFGPGFVSKGNKKVANASCTRWYLDKFHVPCQFGKFCSGYLQRMGNITIILINHPKYSSSLKVLGPVFAILWYLEWDLVVNSWMLHSKVQSSNWWMDLFWID